MKTKNTAKTSALLPTPGDDEERLKYKARQKISQYFIKPSDNGEWCKDKRPIT